MSQIREGRSSCRQPTRNRSLGFLEEHGCILRRPSRNPAGATGTGDNRVFVRLAGAQDRPWRGKITGCNAGSDLEPKPLFKSSTTNITYPLFLAD
ncbi:hypothetical protein J6590_017182 [Homalodisca vitripennis]|nr:hypothetical protein J6590_017182 [Homalodisca vitripennis]